MPNIKSYDSPIDTLKPTDRGIEADTMEGRRIGAFYDQAANTIKQSASDQARAAEQKVGAVSAQGQSAKEMAAAVSEVGTDATNYETHREISIGAKNFATLHDNLTNQWNQAASNADPNDPSVVGKFREQMEDKLQDFTEDGFLTPGAKEWAQGQVARERDHMFEKTSADMSSMAMDAVKQNTMVITNKSADSVFNDPSPHNLDMVLGNIKSSVGAMADSSPTLTFADRARIKTEVPQQMGEQVMKSWIYSAAKANPDAAEAVLKSGKYSQFITGADAKQIVSMAKSSRDNDRVMQDRQDKQNFFGAANKVLSQFEGDDGKQTLPDNFHEQWIKLSTMPGANTSEGNSQLRDLMRLNNTTRELLDKPNKTKVDDADTISDMSKMLHDPDVDTTKFHVALGEAQLAGKMTKPTADNFKQIATDLRSINDPLLARDLEAAKELVEPKYMGVSSNPGSYAKFYYDFIHNQYLPAKVAGKLPPNALDLSDDKSMISQAIKKATGGPGATLPAAISANGGVGAPPAAAAPERPKDFPPAAQWDAAKKSWFVMQDGKRFRVEAQ